MPCHLKPCSCGAKSHVEYLQMNQFLSLNDLDHIQTTAPMLLMKFRPGSLKESLMPSMTFCLLEIQHWRSCA
jgi:hypothetical protein